MLITLCDLINDSEQEFCLPGFQLAFMTCDQIIM